MPMRVHTFDSFRYRSYVFIWLATVFSSAGFWLQQVVVGWLAYEVTESAFWTSLALGLDALPILLVGPIGGVLVDNFDRRKLLAFVYSYQVIVTSVFSVVVLTGNLEAWHIFAFIFFMGLSWVISDPARMSLIPNIVPRENLVNAFALNSMAFSVTRLALPALGGVLIAISGPGPTLLLEAALQVCAVTVALYLQVRKQDRPALRLPTVFSDLREGVRYVLSQPILIGLFTLTALPALLVMPSIQGLMPVYAAEVFKVDAKGLGLLLSAVGAGSTLGTFVLASKGDIQSKNVVLIAALIVLALTTALFSINPFFYTAYLNLMVISAAMMTLFSVSSAAVQSMVPDQYRGRVSGLYMLTWGLFPFGSLAAGFLAERLGAPHATQIAAGTMLVLFSLAVWRIKTLRQLG
jgi:MFS family permease